jgi:hypothetical protein
MHSKHSVEQPYDLETCSSIPSIEDLHVLWRHAQKRKGWIYAAENDKNPGLLKLGYTQKNPFERARTLKTAGVVGSFTVVKAYQVVDCFAAEARVHFLLDTDREDGEFFKVTHEVADLALQQVWREERQVLSLFKIEWLLHDTDSKRFLTDGFNVQLWSETQVFANEVCNDSNLFQEIP